MFSGALESRNCLDSLSQEKSALDVAVSPLSFVVFEMENAMDAVFSIRTSFSISVAINPP